MNVPGANISTASDRVTTHYTGHVYTCVLTPVASVQPPPAAEATRVCVVRVTSVVAALARQPPVDTPILQLPTQLSSAVSPPPRYSSTNWYFEQAETDEFGTKSLLRIF